MVFMNFDARGFTFQLGIKEIKETYEASRSAIEARSMTHIAELQRMQSAAEETGDLDRDAALIRFVSMYKIEKDFSAQQLIKQSFLTMLFHHWERSYLLWMGTSNATFTQGCDWITAHGIAFETTSIDILRKLVNGIKHNNLKPLFKLRPDLFPSGTPTHDDLIINEVHMEEFFAIVGKAGLQQDSNMLDDSAFLSLARNTD